MATENILTSICSFKFLDTPELCFIIGNLAISMTTTALSVKAVRYTHLVDQMPSPKSHKAPAFTIITVVRNGEDVIAGCVESVLNQTFQDFEYIVIDGNSTDSTLSVIKEFRHKNYSYISEADLGLYDAMNKGISMAKGNWIGILNSDDRYLKDALEVVNMKFKTHPEAIVYGDLEIQNSKFVTLSVLPKQVKDQMIPHPASFVPVELYKRFGVFNLKFKVAADYELIARFIEAGAELIHINETLVKFHPGGFSQKHRFRSIFETTYIQRKYFQLGLVGSFIRLTKLLISVCLEFEKIRGFKLDKS